VGIIFGGCFGRILAELLVGWGWIDAGVPGIVGMYALMGAGESSSLAYCRWLWVLAGWLDGWRWVRDSLQQQRRVHVTEGSRLIT